MGTAAGARDGRDGAVLDLRRALDEAPMSRAQTVGVALTFALSALDGFDILSISFAAPAIARVWALDKAAIGLLLSLSLAGMAIGSLILAPIADLVGRRRLVLVNLVLMAAGMIAASFAATLWMLGLCRLATGLGIGSMVAVINPLAAEFSNRRRRALAMAVMTIGYPVGGLIGGLAAAWLIQTTGWRAIFVAGGMAALVLLPIVIAALPESPSFLITRPGARARRDLEILLRRFGQPPVEAAPVRAGGEPARLGYRAVFAPGQIATTLRLTLANLLYVLAVYYALTWLPQIIVDAGLAPRQASLAGALVNLAGVAGGLALGYRTHRAGARRATAVAMGAAGVAIAAIGAVPASLPLFLAAAVACGFFLFAGMAGLYTVLAAAFPTPARASGVGFVIGIGRVASGVAPLLAGWLFAAGLGRSVVSLIFGGCALAAAATLALLAPAAPTIDR